jgi:hypothetical protein
MPCKVAVANLVSNPFEVVSPTETIDLPRPRATLAVGTDSSADLDWSTSLMRSTAIRPEPSLVPTTLAVFLDSNASEIVCWRHPLAYHMYWRHDRQRFSPRVGLASVTEFGHKFHTKFIIF